MADLRNGKTWTDLPSQVVANLREPGDGFDGSGARVGPEGVGTSLALQDAAVLAQVLEQGAPLHLTVTVSRSASAGTPRRPSSRRSSRISAMAPARL